MKFKIKKNKILFKNTFLNVGKKSGFSFEEKRTLEMRLLLHVHFYCANFLGQNRFSPLSLSFLDAFNADLILTMEQVHGFLVIRVQIN